MSVALAITKIGEFTSKYELASARINEIQGKLEAAGISAVRAGKDVDPKVNETLRKLLAVYMFLQGLYKEFIDYWKEVIKSTLSLIKSLQELAQGAR